MRRPHPRHLTVQARTTLDANPKWRCLQPSAGNRTDQWTSFENQCPDMPEQNRYSESSCSKGVPSAQLVRVYESSRLVMRNLRGTCDLPHSAGDIICVCCHHLVCPVAQQRPRGQLSGWHHVCSAQVWRRHRHPLTTCVQRSAAVQNFELSGTRFHPRASSSATCSLRRTTLIVFTPRTCRKRRASHR